MEIEKLSGKDVLRNSFWKLFESIGSYGIQFLVTIVLARLLSPHDYGLMAIVLVAITFLGLFINSGISSYLVYMKDLRKEDFLTALFVNIIASFVLLTALLLSTGCIASYYSAPSLQPLIAVMSITLPFNAISSVYNAYAMKLSHFKTLFIRNMIALPVSGIIAMAMAFLGYGVWALVAQQVSSSILLALIMVLSIKVNVDGKWRFNQKTIKPMIIYGSYTLLTTIIAFISDNISDLLIAKKINPKQLGYYNRGCHFPSSFSNVSNNVLCGVLFPAFASYNSDISELKEKFRKTVRLLYYGMFPLFFGLIACSKPLILTLLTEKWQDSIPIMQIICLYYLAIPFLQTGSQICLATGYVKIRMVGETIKMIFTLPLLFFFVNYGIEAVACSRVLVNVLLVAVSLIMNRIIMDYRFTEFLSDMSKPFLVGTVVFISTYSLTYLPVGNIIIFLLQMLLGGFVYVASMKALKIEEMEEIIRLVTSKIKGKLDRND